MARTYTLYIHGNSHSILSDSDCSSNVKYRFSQSYWHFWENRGWVIVNYCLYFSYLPLIASASVVSEKQNDDIFLNNFEVLFKSSFASQSVIKDIDYMSPSTLTSVTQTKGQKKLEIKNTTVIEDSVSPANKSVGLFKLLEGLLQGNIYPWG